MRVQTCLAGRHTACRSDPLRERTGDLLERAILQQQGEQQVPSFDQRQIFLVLRVQLGQQVGRLDVEQGGGNQQELGGLTQVPFGVRGLMGPDVGHELERNLGKGYLRDVQLVFGNQAQEKLKGALEDVEMHLEGLAFCSAQYAARRQVRASDRHRRGSVRWFSRLGQ